MLAVGVVRSVVVGVWDGVVRGAVEDVEALEQNYQKDHA